MESYTAIPYTERTPRPANPILRPAYQGSNPVADIFSLWALQTTVKYLPRVAKDVEDEEARTQMLWVLSHYVFTFSYQLTTLDWRLPLLVLALVMQAYIFAME